MNIVVCMKQVIDLEQIRIKRDTREPVVDGLPVVFGDYEKSALEEAVRIKEEFGGKVTVIAIGSPKLKETIKEALAIGADEANIITDPAIQGNDATGSARILARAIEKLGEWDLILMGDSSADEYSGEVPPRVAERLNLPSVVAVREIEILSEAGSPTGQIRTVRDMGNLLEVLQVDLPAVIGVTSELNTPRLAPLSAILKAGRKPLNEWGSSDLDLAVADVDSRESLVDEISNLAPVQDRKGIIYDDPDTAVAELINALRQEGVLA
jgi:electron transfer flavoprotein beta subunit